MIYHVNFDSLIRVSKMKLVRGFPYLVKPYNAMCKDCQLGKLPSSSFISKLYSSERILDLVHTNLCGLMETQSYHGDKYFILFIDEIKIIS